MRLLAPTAANVATGAVGVASGLLLTVALTRAYEVGVYGSYAWASQLAATLGLLGAGAFPTLAVRLVAESRGAGAPGRARRLALRIPLLAALGALAVLGASWLLGRALGPLAPAGLAVAVAALALSQAVASAASGAMQGAERFGRVFAATLPATGGAAVAAALGAHRGLGPGGVLLVLAAGHALLAALLLTGLRTVLPAGVDPGGPSPRQVRGYFLATTGLVVIDLVVWQKSEVFFLAALAGERDIALYAVAFALAAAFGRSAPVALGGVLTPAFAGLAGRGAAADAGRLFARAVATMACLSAAVALAGWASAPLVLRLLRPDYLAALPLLPPLLLGFALGNVSGTASTAFHGFGRADALLRMGVVLAALNVVADLALIPRFGARGAAWASGLAQAASLPIAIVLLRRTLGFRYPLAAVGRAAAAAACGVLAVLALRSAAPPGLPREASGVLLAPGAAIAAWLVLGGRRDLAAPPGSTA